MSSAESRVAVAKSQGLGLEGEQTVTAAWNRQQVLDQAAQYLALGGSAARRELVRTLIGLDRLLGRQA
jgi:hypothetical protein